ncbi:MAG TPA: ferrochelatase [Baekduia sp.]|nr:ferrochelatase [Baekduia sp.]
MSTGILLMAYGSPRTPDEIEAYYTHIRRGRPPTPELLEELRERYEAIGGSKLDEITRAQAAGVAAELERRHPGEFVVEIGNKHAPPFVEDGVRALHDKGVDRAIGLVLAPHYSQYSVGQYVTRAQAAAEELGGPPFSFVESWHLDEGYLAFLEATVGAALSSLEPAAREDAEVIFTAHSLPERLVLNTGDPYPDQLRETAEAVAARLGLRRFSTAWQSAGRTPEPWIGPDVLDHMDAVAAAGATGIVVCSCGFTVDHLEVLYDVDVECVARARALGIPFARSASLNAGPELIATVSDALFAHIAAQQVA